MKKSLAMILWVLLPIIFVFIVLSIWIGIGSKLAASHNSKFTLYSNNIYKFEIKCQNTVNEVKINKENIKTQFSIPYSAKTYTYKVSDAVIYIKIIPSKDFNNYINMNLKDIHTKENNSKYKIYNAMYKNNDKYGKNLDYLIDAIYEFNDYCFEFSHKYYEDNEADGMLKDIHYQILNSFMRTN